MISGLLHLFLMSMIIFLTTSLILDAPLPKNIVGYFLSLILFILASLSIGMIFGLFFKNSSKMGMITQFAFLPSIMLFGIMFPTILLPDFLQKLESFFQLHGDFKPCVKLS